VPWTPRVHGLVRNIEGQSCTLHRIVEQTRPPGSIRDVVYDTNPCYACQAPEKKCFLGCGPRVQEP
ncbi:hypothetical protein V5799_016571, partial [Amblyomma americanum]